MDLFFHPSSIVFYGLSNKTNNICRLSVENCRRWGFRGAMFGVNPSLPGPQNMDGIPVVPCLADLPRIPELAVLLAPARAIAQAVTECGEAGIKRIVIQSGGFNESSEAGHLLAQELCNQARHYGIRFTGPNGLGVAQPENGLCLPFVPVAPQAPGGFSMITQSGGLGIFLWNMLTNEHLGLAKFVSIGNKLNCDENDFLEYLIGDEKTQVIALYLESLSNGRRLIEIAQTSVKPIVLYKSNTTAAGGRAALSHTAALSNDEAINASAFERAGIIRIHELRDFINIAKAFALPPMRGKRIMLLTQAGGLAVAMADLCEQEGFDFAQPGQALYNQISQYANAGIIRPANPLDLGDIYRMEAYPRILSEILASDQVDGAVFISQRPRMPEGGEDFFTKIFANDFLVRSANEAVSLHHKPLALALYGDTALLAEMKQQNQAPLFESPEEAIRSLNVQRAFHARQQQGPFIPDAVSASQPEQARHWIGERLNTAVGEEALALLTYYGVTAPKSAVAHTAEQAAELATQFGYPVVMKIISPQALHKTEAGGVRCDIGGRHEALGAFDQLRNNLFLYRQDAVFEGVRVAAQVENGYDMFAGGLRDPSFGPVLVFGLGGIHVELFEDVERVLCPASHQEIRAKLQRLRAWKLLSGFRGQTAVDTAPLVEALLALGQLLVDLPAIVELDVNPLRVCASGKVIALDARLRLTEVKGRRAPEL